MSIHSRGSKAAGFFGLSALAAVAIIGLMAAPAEAGGFKPQPPKGHWEKVIDQPYVPATDPKNNYAMSGGQEGWDGSGAGQCTKPHSNRIWVAERHIEDGQWVCNTGAPRSIVGTVPALYVKSVTPGTPAIPEEYHWEWVWDKKPGRR